MSSQISTCSLRSGRSVAAKMRSGPNGTVVGAPSVVELAPSVVELAPSVVELVETTDRDRRPAPVVAGREPAPLVELPVGRQVGLRRDPQHPAAVDHHGAVEDAGAVHERGPDDEHREQVGRPGRDLHDGRLDALEHGVLQEEVVDGVAAQAQLGEHRHGDAVVVAGAGLLEHGARVRGGVGDRDRDRARRDPGESLGVGRVEVHGPESRARAAASRPARGPGRRRVAASSIRLRTAATARPSRRPTRRATTGGPAPAPGSSRTVLSSIHARGRTSVDAPGDDPHTGVCSGCGRSAGTPSRRTRRGGRAR